MLILMVDGRSQLWVGHFDLEGVVRCSYYIFKQ